MYLENAIPYYTSWSFVAFILVLLLIPFKILPTWVIQAVIVNEIAVGIGGNILAVISMDHVLKRFRTEHPEAQDEELAEYGRHLVISNIFVHTLPMILGLYLLPYYRTSPDRSLLKSFVFLLGFFVIWSVTPHDNVICVEKINKVYLYPPLILVLLLPITWIALLVN